MYTCTPALQCLFHPLWIVLWKPECPCLGLWLCLNVPTFVPVPCTWFPMSAPPTNQRWEFQLEVGPPNGAPTSDWRSHLWLEVPSPIGGLISNWSSHLCLEVLHQIGAPPPISCVPTPCLECVHASVHVFMSNWLPILPKPPNDGYMERWVPVCVSQSPCL